MSQLNASQQQAVYKVDGPLMILAGAGSGKTKTIVARINHLLEGLNVSPHRILALTFSNKAAKEMKERVFQTSGVSEYSLTITTFHSFCARLLRDEYEHLGLSRSFSIYDSSESKTVLKAILNRNGISQKEITPSELGAYIEALKNKGYYVGHKGDLDEETEDLINSEFYNLYLQYESEIHKNNAVDFGSLITSVVQLFELYPDILEYYRKRYQYILVDEYQDTNKAQFKLVSMLASYHQNICVVGDEDQSIYSWRGADIRNILDFESVFPNVEVCKLEQNYRSSKNIIAAASEVIANNSERKGKVLWTDNEEGEKIEIVESKDDQSEGLFVAGEITELKRNGINLNDIAIFYRTNAQSRLIEDGLRKKKVNYKVIAGVKFYERKEIKDAVAYLRLLVNKEDSFALTRVINVPARGIGATSIKKIEDEAIARNQSVYDLCDSIVQNYEDFKHLRLSKKIRTSLGEFVDLISQAKALLENEESSINDIYQKLIYDSGYVNSLLKEGTYEAQARVENLEELSSAIKQYEKDHEEPKLNGFLEEITLDSQVDEDLDADSSSVSLMTIHSSKGLEFEYVFIVGTEENLFPSYRSLEEGAPGIEEERRLFYVAMTRAMKKLYITLAQARMLWGNLQFNQPSRFISEIPNQFYEWRSSGSNSQNSFQNYQTSQDFDFNQDTTYNSEKVFFRPKKESKSQFSVEETVEHKSYGEGVIKEIYGEHDNEQVVILFKSGLTKRFLVKFASLTKV